MANFQELGKVTNFPSWRSTLFDLKSVIYKKSGKGKQVGQDMSRDDGSQIPVRPRHPRPYQPQHISATHQRQEAILVDDSPGEPQGDVPRPEQEPG